MEKVKKYLSYFKNFIIIVVSLIFISGWIRRLLGYNPYFWGRKWGFNYFNAFVDPSINFLIFTIFQIILVAVIFIFIYFFKNSKYPLIEKVFISDIFKTIGIFYIINFIFITFLKIIGFPLKPYNLNRPEWPYFLGSIVIVVICIIIGLIYIYKRITNSELARN